VVVRGEQPEDFEAILHVYAEAFRRPRFRQPLNPGSVPPEVGLFEALSKAGDAISELSFTALQGNFSTRRPSGRAKGYSESTHQSRRPSTSSRGSSPRLGAPMTRISSPSGPAS